MDASFHENEKLSQHILGRLQSLRPKLLDLTKRNPLLATRISARSASIVRIVNTTPEIVYSILNDKREQSLRIMPLPPLHEDPADEKSERFIKALREAQNTDEIYKSAMNDLEDGDEKEKIIERALKDRVRESLGLGKRQNKDNLSLIQHAKNNNILPAFDLPLSGKQDILNINYDTLQALLLPEDLSRRINGLLGKSRTWEQETGIHVLHIAIGFLEWKERNDVKESLAPLILMSVKIDIRKTPKGPEFWLSSTGEQAESNFVLTELLNREFNIKLPQFNSEDSISQYFLSIEKAIKPLEGWKVKRQIIVGVFPSGSVSMYMDLDLSKHKFAENIIIKDLLGGVTSVGESPYAEDYDVDSPEIEIKAPHLVMDADSSQISTIVDMVRGKNIAVEGPPGTGKSQTIVNAIATALDSGKKVLFVAEKMAALEVVKSRLEAVGLGEFILPLQAKRSSREEVVNSIRKRVELKQPENPPYYENKIREFNEIRDRLTSYIKIISSTFENTAIKVYDIIGKSLSYSTLLSSLNTNILSKDINDISSYTTIKIENTKKIASQLVSSKSAANASKLFWQSLNTPYLDPFTKDMILKDTDALADRFSYLNNMYANLSNYKLPKSLSSSQLQILYDQISQVETYCQNLDRSLIKYIIKSDLINEFSTFVNKFIVYYQITQFLNSTIITDNPKNLDEQLFKFTKFFRSINIVEIDITSIDSRIEKLLTAISTNEKLLQEIENLKNVFQLAENIDFTFLEKAYTLIKQTPSASLVLRSDILSRDSEQIELRRLCHDGMNLCERKAVLESFIRTDIDSEIAQIAIHHATIKSAGFFSFLFPKYHKAKKYYISITKRENFIKNDAISDLQQLLDWRKDIHKFDTDKNAALLFGMHFHGISTQFEIFAKLLDYYEDINNIFKGYSNNDIRNFLMKASVDELNLIPHIPFGAQFNTYTELLETIKYDKNKLDNLNKCKKIATNLKTILKCTNTITVDKLEEIATQIHSYNSLKKYIENNIQICNVLDHYCVNWRNDYKPIELAVNAITLLTTDDKFTKNLLKLFNTNSLDKLKSHLGQLIDVSDKITSQLQSLSQKTGIDFGFNTEADSAAQASVFLSKQLKIKKA